MDALGVSQFQAHEEGDGLHAEQASVHVVACLYWKKERPSALMLTPKPYSVWGSARLFLLLPISLLSPPTTSIISRGILTKKQVVCIGTESSDLEYLNHVEELSVDISDHRDRSRNVDDIALFHQQFLRLGAYRFDHRVCQQLFPVESLNALVEVDTS